MNSIPGCESETGTSHASVVATPLARAMLVARMTAATFALLEVLRTFDSMRATPMDSEKFAIAMEEGELLITGLGWLLDLDSPQSKPSNPTTESTSGPTTNFAP